MMKNKTTRKSVWGMYNTKVVRKYPIAMLVIGIILGYIGYGVLQKHIEVSNKITISIVVAIIIVLCSLLAFFFVFEDRLKRFFFGDLEDMQPYHSANKFINIYVEKIIPSNNLTDKERHNLKKFASWGIQKILWKQFKLSSFRLVFMLMAALGGYLGAMLLIKQNSLLEIQNEKIDTQNDLLLRQNSMMDDQINLAEAERRGSLNFLIGNILDKIDSELKEKSNFNRSLSPQLIGNIISVSQSLKPYKYLKKDFIIQKPLSPERGQLLVSLLNSNLDTASLAQIYKRGSFEFADLEGAILPNSYMRNINLHSADLSHSDFSNSDFSNAKLSAILVHADLSNCRFYNTHFYNSSQEKRQTISVHAYVNNKEKTKSGSDIFTTYGGDNGIDTYYANFENTNLSNSTFQNIDRLHTDWRNVDIHNAQFTKVKFAGKVSSLTGDAIFKDCEFLQLKLDRSVLRKAEFYNCTFIKCEWTLFDIEFAIFEGNSFDSNNFTNPYPGKGKSMEYFGKRNTLIGENRFM